MDAAALRAIADKASGKSSAAVRIHDAANEFEDGDHDGALDSCKLAYAELKRCGLVDLAGVLGAVCLEAVVPFVAPHYDEVDGY